MSDSKKKIVVIGGGAAGIFSAYLLEKNAPGRFDITVLEKNEYIGGNTRGRNENYDGEKIHIDCGAQFFYETSEPEYCKMLREERFFDEPGLITETDVGITIWNTTKDRLNFRVPNQLDAILKAVEEDPLDWLNFAILTTEAIAKYALEDWTETFGSWINRIPLMFTHHQKEAFKANIARPLLYQFGLVDPDKLDELSAKFVIYYYVASLPWPVDIPPTPGVTPPVGAAPFKLYTCNIGMDGILNRLIERYHLKVETQKQVGSIERDGAAYVIKTDDGQEYPADEIVFGTNPSWTGKLLPDDSDFDDLRDLMAGMKYLEVPVHTQCPTPSYMPGNQDDWSVSNVTVVEDETTGEPTHYGMCVWFGPLKKQSVGKDFFKAWGSPCLDPPDQPVFAEQVHELMVGTPDFMARREKLRTEEQGERGLWYAGGYILDYDTQNSCLKAAANVAGALIHQTVHEPGAADHGFLVQSELLPETQFKGRPELLHAIEKHALKTAITHPAVKAWAELKKLL